MTIQIMNQLRNETSAYHARLEALPFFQALTDHRLPLDSYVNQLRALAIIHAVLEQEIALCTDCRVAAVWHDGLRKLPLLEVDLAFFAARVSEGKTAATEMALQAAEKIRLLRVKQPVALLGCLYVFEGSTLGNCMHQPDILATFHLAGNAGSRYYSCYKGEEQTRWQRFAAAMDSALEEPALHDQVVAAACATFADLETLYPLLHPLKSTGQTVSHATRINPEAGNHPVPADEREIQASLKASTRTWQEFPYFEQRFGERGKRFSDSDTCWLAALAVLEPEAVLAQVEWFARVLAARGMPSVMLEKTLENLHGELLQACPEKAPAYAGLKQAVDSLARQRRRVMPDERHARLAAAFEKSVESGLAAVCTDAGELLVAAVADELCGRDNAVESLAGWLVDSDRFSEGWINAVNTTLVQARNRNGTGEMQ